MFKGYLGLFFAFITWPLYAATDVTSGDITFHFAEDYATGQFVDGQWWVHNNGNDIIITSISPDSYDDNGRVRNGAEINPVNDSNQGFDGLSETGVKVDMAYMSSRNLDPGNTGEVLLLSSGNSLVKTVSKESDDNRPFIDQAAILTVLSATPPENSFRPAYVGIDKTIPAVLSDLNFDALGHYEPLIDTPDISEYVSHMEGVWLDHNTEWTQREIHPEGSMPISGREIAKLTSYLGLQLQLNYTNAEKQEALVAMVQYAIDLYGVLQTNGINYDDNYFWYNNGSYNQGRKLPLLIAGVVLNHSGMLNAVDASEGKNLLFQEDQQTFYVSQENIDEGIGGYASTDRGLAEWASRAWDRPTTLNTEWTSKYRAANGGNSVVTALAVRMMGATDYWNWSPFFDYADRYFSLSGDDTANAIGGTDSINVYAADLWNAYRSEFGDVYIHIPGEVIEEEEEIEEIIDPNSVTSGDITFHFAEEYTTGQFLDGQWWVHNNGGDVVITSITPDSYNDDGRIRNGAELNPVNDSDQGFDGLKNTGETSDVGYSPERNIDPGNTGESLLLPSGSSLIKSISREEDDNRPLISQAAILTVLSETPPNNSFRPAYVGTDKSIPAQLNDLNYNVLGRYARLENTPHISEFESGMQGVWLDHNTEWTQREIHPEDTMPTYGREIAQLTGFLGLQLQLDYTDDEKQDALVAMVQYGIDIYGVLQAGPINDKEGYYWYNSGGHNQGRKLPLLIAGLVLGNADMLAKASENQLFQEDQQTFYVSQELINLPDDVFYGYNDERVRYEDNDLNLPEWGIRPWDSNSFYDKDWTARYRTVTGNAIVITALATRMMNATVVWNWSAFFDYADRYFSIEGEDTVNALAGNSIYKPVADLWEAYRSQLGVNHYESIE